MKYRDKSSNAMVVLRESKTYFLVIAQPGDGETVAPTLIKQKVFTVTPSTNNDGIYMFKARSDQESTTEIDKAIQSVKTDDRIKEVVPALIDEHGKVRMALPGRVTVRFKGLDNRAVSAFLKRNGSEIERTFAPGLYEVVVPKGVDPGDFIETLNGHANVTFAEPSFYGFNDQEVRVSVGTNYPQIRIERTYPEPSTEPEEIGPGEEPAGNALSWNLEKLSLAQAWQLTNGGHDIVIAVIDGRPEMGHEAIASKFLSPITEDLIFSSDSSVSSHATQVSSVIAGESAEILGVAPGARLLPLVVNLNSQAYGERAAAILKAAELARAGKIGNSPFSRMVLSCSWRTQGDIASVRTALEEAIEANVLIVFSAGNEGIDTPHFPSDYSRRPGVLSDGLLSVAATNRQDVKPEYSNFSSSVDLCAPGGDGLPLDSNDIPCADQGGTYGFAAGTSLAVPHVAAAAALALSLNSRLTPKQLKQILKDTTDDIGGLNPELANLLGSGRINANNALRAVADMPGTVDPNEPDGSGTNERHLVTENLIQCSQALERATGWSLEVIQVGKDGSVMSIDLR